MERLVWKRFSDGNMLQFSANNEVSKLTFFCISECGQLCFFHYQNSVGPCISLHMYHVKTSQKVPK